MAKPVRSLNSCFKYLAMKLGKLALFFVLLYLAALEINPESFISLEASESFAQRADGFVSQENFDDLWVLTWVVCSVLSAVVGYVVIMKSIKKIRRK